MLTHNICINTACLDVNKNIDKQRVLMHGHQGWYVRHGLCHIYMRYVSIWVVYSFCLFCCLFIIVTWWYVWYIVWASSRVGVNSILELELQLNSKSNSGIVIVIEIGGIENGIGIENSGIGIENRIDFSATATTAFTSLTNNFLILALTEVILFHVTDSLCNRFVLSSWNIAPL